MLMLPFQEVEGQRFGRKKRAKRYKPVKEVWKGMAIGHDVVQRLEWQMISP
jgi:hypothetical protein